MPYAEIAGWGMHLPSGVMPNEKFLEMGLDTSPEWIASRTGIQERRVAGHDEATSDLAVKAGKQALQVAGCHPKDVDLVLVATCTPDHIMPSTASLVQDRLGATGAGAFDLNAACAGFVYGLTVAAGQIESGRAKNVLVIGADELSIYLDWKDRSTCVLFGDGAGAVLLRASEQPGIMASTTGSDGSGAKLLMIPGGGSRIRANGNGSMPENANYLTMNGPQIFRWATQKMTRAAEEVIGESGLKPEDTNLFVPHQANMRIIESTARRLGLDVEKVFANVRDYGNTSAASIPIALYEAIADGRVKVGDNIILSSFGAGLSWAAVALRWGVEIPEHMPRRTPIRWKIDTQVAAVRSALRRQERKVRATIDERLGRGEG